MDEVKCAYCGNPIVTAPTSTGWTHDGWPPAWQGVRCPGRVSGATPKKVEAKAWR